MDLRDRSVSCIDDSCEKNCNTKFHGIKFKNHKAGKLNFLLRLQQWNLYKETTKFSDLSRQLLFHNRDNKHDYVNTINAW